MNARTRIFKKKYQFALSDLDFQIWHLDIAILVLLRYSVAKTKFQITQKIKLIGEGLLRFVGKYDIFKVFYKTYHRF